MTPKEIAVVGFIVIGMMYGIGFARGYHDAQQMPVPVRLIPPVEYAQEGFLGTLGESTDRPVWTDVLLFVDRRALLADRIVDSEATLTVKTLRPAV